MDNSPTAENGRQVDGGRRLRSIDYPQFSPPGLASSLVAHSLPEPLLSLPVMPPEQQCASRHEQYVLQHKSQSPAGMAESSSADGVSTGEREVVSHLPHSATSALELRLQHMEALCQDLQREKSAMDEQFGQQRKKFMNIMVQKDTELSDVKKSVEQFSRECQQLRQQLKVKEEEILYMDKARKGMEYATREAFDADRIKYEEEIASLHRIIDEQCSDHKREKEVVVKINESSEGRRSPSPGDPSLESDMAKAVQESQVLKAVVVPLEEEIDRLRLELGEAKERLQSAERGYRPQTPPLIDLGPPLLSGQSPLSSHVSPGDNKLHQQLELERSARHDLEMHTRALEEQKALLQEEVVALKTELEDESKKLTAQEQSYQQLQQTWDMANQHFIVAQDKLRQKVYFMEQKQQLQQQQSRSLRGRDCPSPSLDYPSQGRWYLTRTSQQLKSSHRSHSWSEIREKDSSSQLQEMALENELKRVRQRLEQQTATCESYEAQLQRVQEQMLEELDEKDQELGRLREECSKTRAGVIRERRAKEELRRAMEEACEAFKAQIESFQAGMQSQQAKLKLLREQYTQSKHDAQRDLARFSDERVPLFAQIAAAQEEYDCLKVVQAEEAQQYTQHVREVTQGREMAEENVAALQSRLTELQEEKLSAEEDAMAQLAQLSERFQAEKRTRERQEIILNSQLEAARNQIAALEQVKAELGQEQQMREEAMAARSNVEEKSRSFIAEQHRKLELEVAAKQAAEQMVRDLQRQVVSLRSQLNTSQENQKDFVELSQALQVRLARMEEEQETKASPNLP